MDIKNISALIGNTPLAKIVCKVNDKIKTVYAKLEWYNFTGSIKDRIAYYILARSLESGLYKKNQILDL